MVIVQHILITLELNIFQKKFIGKKNITTNTYRIQANDLITFEYFCNGFVNFMLKGKSLLDYTNLFSPKKFEKNNKIIL